MNRLIEHQSQCPFCNEPVLFLIDPSEEEQTYIEDCSVCCRPIEVTAQCDPESEAVLAVSLNRS